jgi:hypothetical protein
MNDVDTACLVREELDQQPERPQKATAAGGITVKAASPAEAAEQPSTAAKSGKPLAPLGALWPSSVLPGEEAPPPQGPGPQKALVEAPAAKPPASPEPRSMTPSVQSTPPRTPDNTGVVRPSATPAEPKTVNVIFALLEPNAKQVSLCGDFNGWASDAAPMKRAGNGLWEMTVALAPGRHQYKFIVDGQWMPDPLARENVWNQHGTLNSVVEVPARRLAMDNCT